MAGAREPRRAQQQRLTMLRPAFMTLMLLPSLSGFAADEAEPLEGAFLDYLANLEADNDDWTLLAAAQDPSPPPPGATKPEQPPKAAASNPAVDER